MRLLLALALSIVTSIGGFLEVGSITTAAQAGAEFRFGLLWAVAIGTVCLIFLTEMSGRFAAVSRHTIADAVRERFGATAFAITLVGMCATSLLVLGAEIGGTCVALQLATGIGFQWWALPVGLALWVLLWRATFGFIENGVSLLGLATLVFLVAAIVMRPPAGEVAAGLVPAVAPAELARQGILAVNILGASLTPYVFYFYSSGAVEEGWTAKDLRNNRIVAGLGMGFGGVLAASVLVVAAMVLAPRGITIDRLDQAALLLTDALGAWGFRLFVGALAVACFGAALDVTLAVAYLVAQGLGWTWGKNLRPRQAARFSLVYTAAIVVGIAIVALGVNPLRLTNVSMVLSAAILPLAVVPFLFLMNDRHYVGEHRNGWVGNAVVTAVITLAFALALVALPLQILGG